MIAPVVVSGVWLLAMLAAVALAFQPGVGWRRLAVLAVAFAVVVFASRWITLQPGWIGVIVGLIAGARVIHGRPLRIDGLLAGTCAGLAAVLYIGSGVSTLAAASASAGLLLAAMLLARGAKGIGFGREAALMGAAFAAPVLALAPEVAAGWRSAGLLNQAGQGGHAPAIPLWALGFAASALLAGVVGGLWIRK